MKRPTTRAFGALVLTTLLSSTGGSAAGATAFFGATRPPLAAGVSQTVRTPPNYNYVDVIDQDLEFASPQTLAYSNSRGSGSVTADFGILKGSSTTSAKQPGQFNDIIYNNGYAASRDGFTISGTGTTQLLTLSMQIDGTIDAAQAINQPSIYGSRYGTTNWSIGFDIETPLGALQAFDPVRLYYLDGVLVNQSAGSCFNMAQTRLCTTTASFSYTAPTSFDESFSASFEIDQGSTFWLTTNLSVASQLWVGQPHGPASIDLGHTAAFTGISGNGLAAVASHYQGEFRAVDGVFTYDSVHALTGGVPEPNTWAMLIAGFGLVGASARKRRATASRG